ncbi:MAG: LOG family protein [Acidimicrobiales bacterium]
MTPLVAGTSAQGNHLGKSSLDKDAMRAKFEQLLELLDGEARPDLYAIALDTLLTLAKNRTGALDMKIATSALHEMSEAFATFKPYSGIRKVTFFGSSRTSMDDALYNHARLLAKRLAGLGWMTVTGAGPGIMRAAMEGAGIDMSLGVNIRLPHEQGANSLIANDPKLVEMRYFFTRKLILVKESHAYVVLPGGFGTLDESFELFTLMQTGKMEPAPVVLLDVPGGSYWNAWNDLIDRALVPLAMIHQEDTSLFTITTSIDNAVDEITHFYSNYHSLRFVGNMLVIRLHRQLDLDQLAELKDEFGDIAVDGIIRAATPFPPERADNDHLELERIALRFDKASYGRLRLMIDRINSFDAG